MLPQTVGLCVGILTTLLAVASTAVAETGHTLRETPLRRRPVAAALMNDGGRLCVVNRQSGSISVIDPETGAVLREQRVGERLSDVAVLADGRTLLVADEAAHCLWVARDGGRDFRILGRIAVARYPVDVTVSPEAGLVSVTSLWSRRVTLLSIASTDADARGALNSGSGAAAGDSSTTDGGSLVLPAATVRLPFSPRCQQFVQNGRRLVVADAFGGQIAVIDPQLGEVESVRELPDQNLRGLTLSPESGPLVLTGQRLSHLAQADYDDIHWGNLMQNGMREISLAALLDPQADLEDGSRVIGLGDLGKGAADPAGITLLPELDGWVACLAGIDSLAVGTRGGGGRIAVGAQPTNAVWDAQRELVYVLCTLDDAVNVVDPSAQKLVDRWPLGPQPPRTPADRGERLFVDGRRSHDNWISCQSCHPDGHTTGGLADTLSDGSYGTPKRILSLLGTRDNNPWGWNGQFRELHEQVARSYTSTLQGQPLSPPEVNDVVAYLHTLRPPPPIDEGERTSRERARIEAGRRVFGRLGCGRCHVPPQTYTIDQMFDVGLSDEAGLQKFNPPSLRGVGHRKRLFHDGRAESLEAVFDDFGHQLERSLSPREQAALLEFLRSL